MRLCPSLPLCSTAATFFYARRKVQSLQREKDDMVDNFRSTTQILLNRIKDSDCNIDCNISAPIWNHIMNIYESYYMIVLSCSSQSVKSPLWNMLNMLFLSSKPLLAPGRFIDNVRYAVCLHSDASTRS